MRSSLWRLEKRPKKRQQWQQRAHCKHWATYLKVYRCLGKLHTSRPGSLLTCKDAAALLVSQPTALPCRNASKRQTTLGMEGGFREGAIQLSIIRYVAQCLRCGLCCCRYWRCTTDLEQSVTSQKGGDFDHAEDHAMLLQSNQDFGSPRPRVTDAGDRSNETVKPCQTAFPEWREIAIMTLQRAPGAAGGGGGAGRIAQLE